MINNDIERAQWGGSLVGVSLDEPNAPTESPRTQLERLSPGSGIGARLDRGAWMALSQREPESWSWGRALATAAISLALGVVIFFTAYREPAFLAGLALAYALVIGRAYGAHRRFLGRQG
jgi:hypothetical protein